MPRDEAILLDVAKAVRLREPRRMPRLWGGELHFQPYAPLAIL